MTDFDEKLPLAHRTLELHARSYKPNDNAGTGYVWITPGHLIKFGLMTDDLSYLEDGHLARLLDSAVLTIDSRGDDCSYGDVGAYRASRASRPSGLQTAAIGTWFYNDGRYRWLYDWMEQGQEWKDSFRRDRNWGIGGWEVYDGFFFKDVPPVEPVELLGVRASMLDTAAHDFAKDRARNTDQYHGDPLLESDVPLAEAFDKLAFRCSFDRRSEYLLIDGPTGFSPFPGGRQLDHPPVLERPDLAGGPGLHPPPREISQHGRDREGRDLLFQAVAGGAQGDRRFRRTGGSAGRFPPGTTVRTGLAISSGARDRISS